MEGYKPCAAMVVTQCIYAAMALWVKAVFTRGRMSPIVFVVYRQAVVTIILVLILIVVNRRKIMEIMCPGVVGFSLVFVASFIGNISRSYTNSLLRVDRATARESVYVLPRAESGVVFDGNGHDELDTGHHLRDGNFSRMSMRHSGVRIRASS
ncbi:hypothetical protein PR202_gb22573 [Eleusine coracana subsp. coracana]|uniref:WAT1-related protein n=1 Tax=Eleusine coracana subsp. coracana TaxID=191504 RepID=A0AAV5FGM7_ELECO|nr:hypothetical protein PR202_gb22573 [Eleusine coracana subsp. coracana]